MDTVEVSIREITGGTVWVSMEDGMAVYRQVSAHLAEGRKVALSFAGGEHVITAFLNVAVGQLYCGRIAEDVVESNLGFAEVTDADVRMIGLVVTNAKRFFAERRAGIPASP